MEIATHVWVAGLIRRAEIAGAFAAVVKRGDDKAGAVLVKAYDTSTRRARLFSEATGLDGRLRWIEPVQSEMEGELDAYAAGQRRHDPDLWIVEIEDREGRAFLEP